MLHVEHKNAIHSGSKNTEVNQRTKRYHFTDDKQQLKFIDLFSASVVRMNA